MRSLLRNFQKLGVLLAVVLLCVACSKVPSISENPWEILNLPTESNLSDVAFTDDKNHGWIVGSNTTLLESTDAGKTWQPKILDLGEQKY
ncbi:MAG: YCF48-related protein, partial [Phormidium sp.]